MPKDGTQSPDGAAPERTDALAALIRAAGRRPAPSADDYRRVWAASRGAWLAQVRARRRRTLAYALAASVGVLAAGLAIFVQLAPPNRPVALAARVDGAATIRTPTADAWRPLGAQDEIVAGASLRTAVDGRAAFHLRGGASLRVRGDTELVFVGDERIELESGTVYVDSSETGRVEDLVIDTPFGTVRDVGTQFEVHASAAALRIRVREGSVQLLRSGRPGELETPAGEELTLLTGGRIDRRAIAPDDPAWNWAVALAEPIEIEGQSALEVLRWAARETGRRLVFEDAVAELRARNAILSGGEERLTPLQAVEVAVATAEGLEYEMREGVIVIGRR